MGLGVVEGGHDGGNGGAGGVPARGMVDVGADEHETAAADAGEGVEELDVGAADLGVDLQREVGEIAVAVALSGVVGVEAETALRDDAELRLADELEALVSWVAVRHRADQELDRPAVRRLLGFRQLLGQPPELRVYIYIYMFG